MALKLVDNKMVELCDCIGCPNEPRWKQGFIKRRKSNKVDIIYIIICNEHHDILRTKVPESQELDEDVLKWLLIQSPNPDRVSPYGIVKGPVDTQLVKELKKIKL